MGIGRLENTPDDFEFRGLTPVEPEVWEDGPRLKKTPPGAYEWWYMDGHFANGMLVVVSFTTAFGPNNTLVGFISLNIANEEGVLLD